MSQVIEAGEWKPEEKLFDWKGWASWNWGKLLFTGLKYYNLDQYTLYTAWREKAAIREKTSRSQEGIAAGSWQAISCQPDWA